ncbi:MAG: hypothetical protein K2X02_06370 [Alphaproteobacteria bacterium]|nr:hypothetical protein [Alphaproteobacteria bacterium]
MSTETILKNLQKTLLKPGSRDQVAGRHTPHDAPWLDHGVQSIPNKIKKKHLQVQ